MPGRRRQMTLTNQSCSKTEVSISFTGPHNLPDLRNTSNSHITFNLPTLSLNTAAFNLSHLVIKCGGFSAFIAYALFKIYPQAFTSKFRYTNEINDSSRVLSFVIEATGSTIDAISNDINGNQIIHKITRLINSSTICEETLRNLQEIVIQDVQIGNWSTGEGSSWGVSVVEEDQTRRRQSVNLPTNINTGDDNRHIETTTIHNYFSTQNEASSDCIDNFHQSMDEHLQSLTCQNKMMARKLVATNPVNIKVSPKPLSVKSQLSNENQRIEMQNGISIQLEDIFSQAAEKVEECCVGLSDEDTEIYRKIHSRSILLTGQAGMGKSTATYSITRKVLNGEMPALEDVRHISYFQIRDINFEEEMSLIDFVTTYSTDSGLNSFTSAEKDVIKRHVLANAEKYLFIFDGLDETNMEDLETEAKSCEIEKKCSPSNLIKLIMKGSHLKGAFKLWTSRSQHAYSIGHDHRPLCIMQLSGLDDEAQSQLCQQASTDKWPEVSQILNDQPDLKAMCYVPVWCVIVCLVLRNQILEHGRTGISTITELLLLALKYFMSFIKTGSTENTNLLAVANLAWKGLKDRRLIFKNQHFVDANVTKCLQQSLLHTNLQEGNPVTFRIMVSEQRSYFVHFIWQELFASIHLAAMPKHEFESAISVMNDKYFEVVSRLLFGLFNKNNENLNLFPGMQLDESKLNLLLENAMQLLWHDGEGKKNLLQICCWAQELNCSIFTKQIADIFPEVIDFTTTNPDDCLTLVPSDVLNLNYVLDTRRGEFSKIDAQSIHFMGNSLELFGKTLQLTEKIKHLDLSYVNIGDGIRFVVQSILKISCLDLVGCNITHEGVSHLTRILKSSPHFQMKRLDLSCNNIGDIGIKKLGVVVRNFLELSVQHCGFGMSGWQSLADKIKALRLPIEILRIDGNNLGDPGIKTLKQCWQNVKAVYVRNCRFSDNQKNQLMRNIPSCSNFTCEVYT